MAGSKLGRMPEASTGTTPLNATVGGDSQRRTGVAPVSIFRKITHDLAFVRHFTITPHPKPSILI
jgi:hypothetical protein